MKKAILTLSAVLVSLFLLSGCDTVEDQLKERMFEESGLQINKDYQDYERNNPEYQRYQFDENGNYIYDDGTEAEERGPIHICFAQNNKLNIHYFTDSAHKYPLNLSNCGLNPGDSIFASVISRGNDAYSFSEFRVYECNGNNRTRITSLEITNSNNNYIITIPNGFEDTELSIEPVGAYTPRQLSLNAFYRSYTSEDDNEGSIVPIIGTWTVNGNSFQEDHTEVSPIESYMVSYHYNPEEYFYIDSEPKSKNDSVNGVVSFDPISYDDYDATTAFSVELQRYLNVQIRNNIYRLVSIDGGEQNVLETGKKITLDHLRYGQQIVIRTNKEWKELESLRELVSGATNKNAPGELPYEYTLSVPQPGASFRFDPSEYDHPAHGKLRFIYLECPVTSVQELNEGRKLYYEAESIDDGYWLPGDDHFIIVGNEAETDARLRDIQFIKKERVTVFLHQPPYGGQIIYRHDGLTIHDNSITLFSGEEISIEPQPWPGWETVAPAKTVYSVGIDPAQTADVNGIRVDKDFFREMENHKPVLSLLLDDSVGEDMIISLDASGYGLSETQYQKAVNLFQRIGDFFRDTISGGRAVINEKDENRIGTEREINLHLTGRWIEPGKAVRLQVTKTDTDGIKETEIKYYNDEAQLKLIPIRVYDPGTNATAKVGYRSVEIKVAVVPVGTFSLPTPLPHSNITVRNAETGAILQDGDLLEGSRKVTVTIMPESGYYISGSNITNDIYQKTMKFSKFQKDIVEIVEKHPVRMYIKLRLDSSDTFASYIYRLGNKDVSGEILVKEGQKLKLTYIITDPAYRLAGKWSGLSFLNGLGATDSKTTETITITLSMHDQTITKKDFGIEVVKEG